MRAKKTLRSLGVVATAALLMGALVAPAEAAKKKKKKPKACPAVAFVEPESPSASRTEVPGGDVVTVTNAHTAEVPLVFEYEHGAALWDTVNQEPIIEDTKWFNIQVDSTAPAANLFIRQEWAFPSPSDMDLYLWDAPTGTQVNVSGAFNQTPVNLPFIAETGAMGYESISEQPVGDCTAYAIESRAFWTAGESMTLSVWLQ